MSARPASRARVALSGVLLLTAAGCGADVAAEPAVTSTAASTDTTVAVTYDPDQPVVVIRGNDYSSSRARSSTECSALR
jgi:hypothetical protein